MKKDTISSTLRIPNYRATLIQVLGSLSSSLAEQDLNGFVFLFMALP